MEDAVRIANLISDRDIHNGDVALQNAIVRWDSNASKYKAMMIDFGQCVLTNATHDKWGWRRQQQARMRKAPWKGIPHIVAVWFWIMRISEHKISFIQ